MFDADPALRGTHVVNLDTLSQIYLTHIPYISKPVRDP